MFVSINHIDKEVFNESVIKSLKENGRIFAFIGDVMYMSMNNNDLGFLFNSGFRGNDEKYFDDNYEDESVSFMTCNESIGGVFDCKIETFRCLKDMDAAESVAKENLEYQGDDLLSFFGEETVLSWAKNEYAHGACNFPEFVENSVNSEESIAEQIAVYDGYTYEDVYIDSEYEDKNLDWNNEETKQMHKIIQDSNDEHFALDAMKNQNIELTKFIGFLEDKDENNNNNIDQKEKVFQAANVIFEQENLRLAMNKYINPNNSTIKI